MQRCFLALLLCLRNTSLILRARAKRGAALDSRHNSDQNSVAGIFLQWLCGCSHVRNTKTNPPTLHPHNSSSQLATDDLRADLESHGNSAQNGLFRLSDITSDGCWQRLGATCLVPPPCFLSALSPSPKFAWGQWPQARPLG